MTDLIASDDIEASQGLERLRAIAHKFENRFGGESRETNLLSTWRSTQLDMDALFPAAASAALNDWGMPAYYVPARFGGTWKSTDELMLLLRLIARRDLTIAIAHAKTFLGSVSIWIGGSDEQAQKLSNYVLRGEIVSLGLTELSHGSDILASDTIALRDDDGYTLSGEKYLINNATRCRFITVFARTASARNARDFSLFLVDKKGLASSTFVTTPRQITHGIRGADISGIAFTQARLDNEALIGREGGGLECVLKGFQITRTLCAGLSAGGADSALRSALRFASERRVAGRQLSTLPLIRAILAEACADMLIIDIVSQIGARAINVMPELMSLVSAIVKAEIPGRADRMVEALGEVLGARAYLERGAGFDGYAKIQRDIRLVAIFDGNTIVNLHAVRLQIKELSRRRRQGKTLTRAPSTLFDLGSALPTFRREALSLACHGGDPVVAGLDGVANVLLQDDRLAEETRGRLRLRLHILLDERQALETEALEVPLDARRLQPADFEMARRYCRIFASVCCIEVFLHNRCHLADAFGDGVWLADVLDRLAGMPIPDGTALLSALEKQLQTRQLFGVLPIDLALVDQPEMGAQ